MGILALITAMYGPRFLRHMLPNLNVVPQADGSAQARANFVVFEVLTDRPGARVLQTATARRWSASPFLVFSPDRCPDCPPSRRRTPAGRCGSPAAPAHDRCRSTRFASPERPRPGRSRG